MGATSAPLTLFLWKEGREGERGGEGFKFQKANTRAKTNGNLAPYTSKIHNRTEKQVRYSQSSSYHRVASDMNSHHRHAEVAVLTL